MIKSICIFCGSSIGNNNNFAIQSYNLVQQAVKKGYILVYGGGNIGIMNVVAETAIKNKGKIIGVVPKILLDLDVVRTDLTELIIVNDMFDRMKKFFELSDCFIVLPGGIGTITEFFETFTALQLEIINKPIGILNVDGYFNELLKILQNCIEKKFLRKEHFDNLIFEENPLKLLNKLENYTPKKVENWISELKNKQYF